MKQNILKGMILIGAIALSSCSTQNKLASSQTPDDDVYYTKAKAGEQPVYAAQQQTYRQDNNGVNDSYGYDDDYYNYDSYSARINRFYNYSPFLSSYYDDLYYGSYSPYYSGFGLGFGAGFGYYGGGYFGYNPYSFYGGYGGFGYNPYFGYSNYGYYGSTVGYGYSPYWGAVSYYNVARNYNRPRPSRGDGNQGSVYGSRTGVAYGGVNRGVSYTGRQPITRNTGYASQGTNSTRPDGSRTQPAPVYQPQPQTQSVQPSGSSSSGGGGRSGGGGGGGRPGRP